MQAQVAASEGPETYVITGDLDEVPSEATVRAAQKLAYKNSNDLFAGLDLACFRLHMFKYSLHWLQTRASWTNPKIVLAKNLVAVSGQLHRSEKHCVANNSFPKGDIAVSAAGWHMSTFGTIDEITNKLWSFAHKERRVRRKVVNERVRDSDTHEIQAGGRGPVNIAF